MLTGRSWTDLPTRSRTAATPSLAIAVALLASLPCSAVSASALPTDSTQKVSPVAGVGATALSVPLNTPIPMPAVHGEFGVATVSGFDLRLRGLAAFLPRASDEPAGWFDLRLGLGGARDFADGSRVLVHFETGTAVVASPDCSTPSRYGCFGGWRGAYFGGSFAASVLPRPDLHAAPRVGSYFGAGIFPISFLYDVGFPQPLIEVGLTIQSRAPTALVAPLRSGRGTR